PYRSVSGLAILGLGLAAGYAVLTVLWGLFAWWAKTPWLLPGWSLLLPLLAAVLCLVARAQIRAAEGTRSGESLARWGLGLSLVSGLIYRAFFKATLLAGGAMGIGHGEELVKTPPKGRLELAFPQTNRAPRPDNNQFPPQNLEISYNTSADAGRPGPFSQ